jgi:hypothetical protein
MRPRLHVFGLLVLIAVGCDRSSAGGAAGGPRESAGTSGAQAPAQGGHIARPSSSELSAFAVGQWSKYRIEMDDGTKTEITYKIVAQEQGAYWLEIVRGAADAGTVMQLLIEVKNRADPSSLTLTAAKIRMPNGHVRELRGEMLEPTAEGYKKALADVFVAPLAGSPQEDVTVPAGTFHGAYKRQQKIETSKASSEQTVWVHPAVPISGVVKSEEISKPNKTVLLAYGMTGAQSEMQKQAKPVE